MLRTLSPQERIAGRYIPKGAVKVSDKLSDAVAYIYTNPQGHLAAIAYYGSALKPAWNFRFQNNGARERKIMELFASRQGWLALKAERKAEASKPHKLQLGHILVSSWGYDQTNIDFYEVTKVIGSHMVEVREIGQVRDGAGGDHGTCAPKAGAYIGEASRHRVSHNSVTISSFQHASLWDGRPLFWSSWH